MILDHVGTHRVIQRFIDAIGLMEGVFLERVGTGRGTYYQLGHEIFSSLGD